MYKRQGRRGDDASCIDEDVQIAFFYTLFVDLLGGRDDDRADILVDVFSFHNFRGYFHIGQSAVGTGSDDHLIDFHFTHLVDGLGIFRKVRESHCRLEQRKIDIVYGLSLIHISAFVHCGPFANIAHGCNSIMATKMALKLADYVVTEAGFAADLGAEKFVDIKCRKAGLKPSACVIVATVKALKYHGGVKKEDLAQENLEALEKGLPNLLQHVENVTQHFGLPAVVAINEFPTDTEAEIKLVEEKCRELGVNVVLSQVWGKGGKGPSVRQSEILPSTVRA